MTALSRKHINHLFLKDFMKTIYQNADHMAATEQLTQLCEGHAAAVFEETALLAQLNDQPDSKPSALDRAKAMLTGGTPAPRQDRTGLQQRLDACRESLALLAQAIGEQRQVMAALVQAQSAIVNSERKADHIKAAKDIQSALAGLRDAMRAEQAIRAEIAAGGYQCSLEAMERGELIFADSEAVISKFAKDVNGYLVQADTEGKKQVTVHLLIDHESGAVGDVVTLPGHQAAALVRHGRAELTDAKPSKRLLAQRIAEIAFGPAD